MVFNRFLLDRSLPLAAALFKHYKINHVKAIAVGFAVAAIILGGVCFGIALQAWRFVWVERAAQAVVPVGLYVVLAQDSLDGQLAFDGGDFHC